MPSAFPHVGRMGAGLRTVLSPATLTGTAVEMAWLVTHLALYPGGLAAERRGRPHDRFSVQDLPPLQRALLISNLQAAGTPVLLVHGLVDNRSVFTVLRRGLRRRGFEHVVSMNYSPLTHDIRTAATLLAQRVEELCDLTGYDRIHVVGHSLGGLIARYYVQCLGGDERVDTLVTLGSPHGGTLAAHLVPHPLIRQLRPGSALMTELSAPARGCRTRFVAFYSDVDQLILPASHGRLTHPDLDATNVLAAGVGHLSLPVRGRVVHAVCSMLAHLPHTAHEPSAAPSAGPGHAPAHGRVKDHDGVTSITANRYKTKGKTAPPPAFTSSVRHAVGPI
jgi:pimeloyl-ACP methyl ester carboxylesterase